MSLIEVLFQHQLTIKMFHFQTAKYSAHKESDNYLVKYEKNLDRLMEVMQGNGRLQNTTINLNFTLAGDLTIDQHLKDMMNYLNSVKMSEELNGIKEEMVSDIQQLRYLLTFN